jgi:membrane fusion protein, multidrug efflux system
MSTEAHSERRRSVRWRIVWVFVPLAIAAIAAAKFFGGDFGHLMPPVPTPAVPVSIATAERQDVPVYLTGIGTVQALNTVTMRTQVSGQLTKVLFTEGQKVKQGDLLAVVDPRPFQATLDQAVARIKQDQANLENAKVILARDASLAKEDFASQQALDNQQSVVAQLEAQIAQDQASRDAAAVQLSYTQITSPLDGTTGVRLVDQGNIVHPTDTNGIVVVTQTQPISVLSTLPEDDLEAVREAQKVGPVPVTAFTRDGAVNLGSGTLSLINNEIEQASGNLLLKSTFPNADEKLWPGQFVEVRLQRRVAKNAVTVPSSALQRGQQGFFVYVVNADDTVDTRNVKTGDIASGVAIIESGISVGDRVVTSGSYQLEPGVRVVIKTEPTGAGSDPKR